VEALLDNTRDDPEERAPLVLGDHDDLSITEKVCRIVEAPSPRELGTWRSGSRPRSPGSWAS
jgi:hypothetical protein